MLALLGAPLGAAVDPVAAILDQARGTPPEIFADVAFHLLDADRIPAAKRVALLEEIFLQAGTVQNAMPLRPAVLAYIPSQVGIATRSGALRLDALSIRCRAVQKLLTIDPQRARERFADIPAPETPKPECKSGVLADPTIYFETLAAVVSKASFTREEQSKQIPFWMMESAVRRIRTSLEIVAAARNLPQLVHDQKQAEALAGAFAVALGIDDCNRNFSAALHSMNLAGAILAANDKLTALGAPRETLPAALRGYLVRHLTATVCADSMEDSGPSVEALHAAIVKLTAVPRISDQEMEAAKSEGEVVSPRPTDQSSYREMMSDIAALGSPGLMRANTPPVVTPELGYQAGRLFDKLRVWKGAPDQDPLEVFHQKCGLYGRLMQRFWSGEFFRLAVRGFIATLEESPAMHTSIGNWLSELHTIQWYDSLSGGTVSQGDVKMAISLFPEGVIPQAMMASSSSAVALYGRLAQLDHTPWR